jgi:hypothetical protein
MTNALEKNLVNYINAFRYKLCETCELYDCRTTNKAISKIRDFISFEKQCFIFEILKLLAKLQPSDIDL